jgi:CHRD domain
MRFKLLASATVMAAPFMLLGASANATEFSAKIVGFEELPAIFSTKTGTLDLDLNRNARTIAFKLTFPALSSPVTQSHIHFGKRHVAGGVTVFFCTNLGNAPAGTAACPAGGGTVTGTITGANVLAPAGQDITAGNFDELVTILENGTAYANVHTVNHPGGEIRGQIRERERDDDR